MFSSSQLLTKKHVLASQSSPFPFLDYIGMEYNLSRQSRASLPHSSTSMKQQRRSGYEPSDTETEWHESPPPKRDPSPMKHTRRHAITKIESDNGSGSSRKVSPATRRNSSKSPYKPRREDGTSTIVVTKPRSNNVSPLSVRRNVSPFSKSERRRHVSPFKLEKEESELKNDKEDENENVIAKRKQSRRTSSRDEKAGNNSQFLQVGRASETSPFSRRSMTAPRARTGDKDQQNNHGHTERKERTPSPVPRNMIRKQREMSLVKSPSVGELNEIIANVKINSNGPPTTHFESMDSVSAGDIFFSRDVLPKNGGFQSHLYPRPTLFTHQHSRANGEHNPQNTPPSSGLSRIISSAASRQSIGKLSSSESSNISDASGNFKKFAANRWNQSDAWFSCMRKGTCRRSKLSPEKRRAFDEASFIEKAFVVEKLRQFWADKHQPSSLNGFTCHKHEAQLLKQTVSQENCPNILLKGPSGSGKKALAMAILLEIFGEPCSNISQDLRYFPVKEKRPMQVVVPITSSAHHVELNVNLEGNSKYALMGLVKEIKSSCTIIPEISLANFKADFKVIVLYEVDLAPENIQHLIKWIMDCYTDACKLILCCEDDVHILESVKNRCKVIKVDAPVTHEIMEVLIQIARKEDFDLSMSFAAKIAAKSKQNLRKAIMALEACKAHNYPFADDQPIPFGWEEVLIELAAEILADPSPKRLFFVRGKIQKLLIDFVHPKLILLKLVEEFLKGVEVSLKREIYYWHAYYDKRLPTGTSALLKLEEFVAKFMSIYRKSSGTRLYV